MSKKILEAEFQKIDRAGTAEDRFTHFLHKWWQTILYTIGGLIALSLLLYQFTRGSEASAMQDYMRVDAVFSEFVNAPADHLQEKLEKLKGLLAKHPGLRQKYEGKIAQALLSRNQPALAIPFAHASMRAAKKIGTAPYQVYSDTSLLIAQGKLAEALERAKALQSSIPQSDTLYAFNLMRIASLEAELGHAKEANAAYRQLLTLAESNPLFNNWLNSYKEGDLTFRQFIEHGN